MKHAIIGAGGFGREVFHHMKYHVAGVIEFYVDDEYCTDDAKPLSSLDVTSCKVLVAIGDPAKRQAMVNRLPPNTIFDTFIHPSVIVLDDLILGEGSIVCAGSILTTNIIIGKHAHLNLQTTIGHDCVIGDFFTTAPHVAISGNCDIGHRVYFGTNSCAKEKLVICDDVTIGLNAGVVKNIHERGTYIGTPCRKIS
jgi:sugar O-acyltransferase (sialic acid O-acetyltransferase NeuD family)